MQILILITNFNPRAPYGARLKSVLLPEPFLPFQSTRPIRGATATNQQNTHSQQFQSTRPIRGATIQGYTAHTQQAHFNPRAPYGARRHASTKTLRTERFQSTRPIRGATGTILPFFCPYFISIHAPHTGRDGGVITLLTQEIISIHAPHTGRDTIARDSERGARNFNPRAPYGARQQKCIIYVLHFCNNRQSKHKNQQETSSVRTFF